MDLDDPTTACLAVARALDAARIRAAVYGGLALAAYGEPRETRDVDLAVVGVHAELAAAVLERAGLPVLVAFERVAFGGLWLTRLTLLGTDGDSGLNVVDLVEPRSLRYAAAALERAIGATLRDQAIRVLSPEDFVLFKVLSTRERDVEDAATVLRALGGELDRAWIAAESAQLAAEVPEHEVAARWQRVVTGAAA